MKKILILACAAALSISALSVTALAASASMTASDAEELAAKYLPQGTEKVWTGKDDGLYEVDFYNSTLEERYEVKVNPVSGKITEVDSELLDHRGSRDVTLTQSQAEAAVTGELPQAEILSTTLDRDDGFQTYEVRFSTDGFRGKYTIHPENGEILEREIKVGTTASTSAASTSNASSSGVSSNGLIGSEKAKSIAQAQATGAVIVKCELDRDDGRLIYEVEARDGRWEYEFEIDAQTGNILKSDVEYDD
jgi:uncharacterized membrane protein YkoI